ncbi:MAG: outer membrane lipoprotein carrier protein LolA [Bacteroidetes bacterium]|jgi:outer membrane lipoprotein-sorting protein|nr:outer membrane lipoprotein carrier protein LolA [Bacteroidota bacterium]
MKKLILVSLLTFASLSAFSQQDSQAQQLLNEVTKKVRSYNNILIEFKYFMINPEKSIKQETRGDVTLEGNKYVLNMMGTTRIFDGNKIYTIVPEDEEVTISTYTADNDAEITPNKMLTFYEKGYNAQMDIQQNVKGRKIQYIKLTPTDSKSTVKNVLLGIDAQTKHIYKMIQSNKEGMQFTVTINSFKTNQPLSKTLFTFDEDRYRNNGYYINKL